MCQRRNRGLLRRIDAHNPSLSAFVTCATRWTIDHHPGGSTGGAGVVPCTPSLTQTSVRAIIGTSDEAIPSSASCPGGRWGQGQGPLAGIWSTNVPSSVL